MGLSPGAQPKTFDDYILGGRSSVVCYGFISRRVGYERLAVNGAARRFFIFLSGILKSWIAIGLTLGAWINWKLVAGRLRVHTASNNNALTLPDYFTGRFEDKSRVPRIISALVILGCFHYLLRIRYCRWGTTARKHLRYEL